ncbi:hypothetical protein HK101_004952 [Irineochytrium annulatum]|nr:hypothetical protein HK101_004952 [Irineochytrium annulatum]
MNSSTTGAFMDSNGCMVLPPGTTINLAAQKMWTAEYAWIATGVFGAFMLLAVFNLLSAHKYSHNGKARPLFLLLSLFALFRTAGFATRGWAATISGGPSIPLFISVLVLQAAGFLPLLKILFQVSSEWASTGTKSKTARGVFKALPRVLDVLLFITVSAAITGASWVGQAQASLCTPSNIAVTIRNVSILMISALTWIGVIITLSVILMTRKRIAIWLFVQALLLAVRTSYTLISTLLMPTILQDEVSFYFMSIVPEALFVAPFIAGLYFLDRYLPEEEEELGDIFRGGADYNKPFTSNKY